MIACDIVLEKVKSMNKILGSQIGSEIMVFAIF